MKKERIEWIDSIRGIVLIFICISHFNHDSVPESIKNISQFTGTCFVPFFFFISGVLFSDNFQLKKFVSNKINKILIPFFAFSFFFIFLHEDLLSAGGLDYVLLQIKNIFLLGYGPERALPLWFLQTLFEVLIFMALIIKYIRHRYLRLLVVIGLFSLGYVLQYNHVYPLLGFPRAFIALFFCFSGYLLKDVVLNLGKMKLIVLWAAIVVTFFITIYFFQYNQKGVLWDIHNPILYIITGLSGIMFLLLLSSKLFAKRFFLSGILKYLSENGLVVLATHLFIARSIHAVLIAVGINSSWILFCVTLLLLILISKYISVPIYNKVVSFFINKSNKAVQVTEVK